MDIFSDSHAHLTFDHYAGQVAQVVERAKAASVEYIHTIGTSLSDVPALDAVAKRYSGIYYSVGIHPHNVDQENIDLQAIVAAVTGSDCLALGETGLDFYYEHGSRLRQEESFRNHIRAAHMLHKPLIVHSRDAEEQTLAILKEENAAACGAVIHCFSGSMAFARAVLDMGFYISFSGIITFKKTEELQQVVACTPLDRMLIETDAPYLAPVPYRGKQNEPAFVVQVAKTIAAILNVPLAQVASATTDNFLRLFRVQQAANAVYAYAIGRGLYLNVTKSCTLHCQFCPKWVKPIVHQYDLTLERNPSAATLIASLGDLTMFDEVVFCGYGEPTLRLPVILAVAAEVKKRGKRVRLNTDGLANLVYKRDVTPSFRGLIDAVSISLNAQDEATYNRHCQPALAGSYEGVLAFVRAVKEHVPEVTITVVAGLEGVDVAACQRIASELGVGFRARFLNRLG